MKKINYFFLLTGLLIFYLACDLPEHYWSESPECHPSAFIGAAMPASLAYQSKVRVFLADKKAEDFRYFFDTFMDEGAKTYMMTEFRNENECFTGKILVRDWSKLEGMRRVNGKAYPKELYDLKWEIQTIDGKQEILYVDMHDIID